jgi:hypothetical protein
MNKEYIFTLEYESPVETLFLGDFDYTFVKFEQLICNALHFENTAEAGRFRDKLGEYHPYDLKIGCYKLNQEEYVYERQYII